MAQQDDESKKVSDDKLTARERFDEGRMSRRAALRKVGIRSGALLLGLFAVDDLARIAARRLAEQRVNNEIGESVAREFRSAGVAFAEAATECSQCEDCVEDESIDCEACNCPTASGPPKKKKKCNGTKAGLWCKANPKPNSTWCQDCCDGKITFAKCGIGWNKHLEVCYAACQS